MKKIAHKRHLAKSLTWRVIGTFDTVLLGWFVSGDLKLSFSIGGVELITKIVLYYMHERIWYKLGFFKDISSRVRHILKTITWRIVGTIDTVLLVWIISGKIVFGLSMGALEMISKMLLYYIHERIWYKSNFGLIKIEEINTQTLHE